MAAAKKAQALSEALGIQDLHAAKARLESLDAQIHGVETETYVVEAAPVSKTEFTGRVDAELVALEARYALLEKLRPLAQPQPGRVSWLGRELSSSAVMGLMACVLRENLKAFLEEIELPWSSGLPAEERQARLRELAERREKLIADRDGLIAELRDAGISLEVENDPVVRDVEMPPPLQHRDARGRVVTPDMSTVPDPPDHIETLEED